MFVSELDAWFYDLDPAKFPYEAEVGEFRSAGKDFVSPDILGQLDRARSLLPQVNSPWPNVRTLACFLDSALDKPDGRYDYPTYLALSQLQLPSVDDPAEQTPFTRSRVDRLIVQLAADALHFELQAADGRTSLLPDLRPPRELQLKRYRHALRAIRPALNRLNLGQRVTSTDPEEAARQASAVVRADMSVSERRSMLLSVLPVYTIHDEYMFLRTLQIFETTFALIAVNLRAAVAALRCRDTGRAVHYLGIAEQALREASPVFSMLATMQVESFRTFRQFTEGASAIQSRNYKIIESLCRTPDAARTDSASYQSVPEVRARVLAGQDTLDDAFREARDSGDLPAEDLADLTAGMEAFAGALLRWRTTHYRLAVRMLGDVQGSGYTAGAPYLAACRTIPVFKTVGATTGEMSS